MNQNRKTGPVMADEARALRECAALLAPLHTAEERRNIALSVERVIHGQGPDLLPFRFFQIAALFYPGDAERAKNLETKLQEAVSAGDLVTVMPPDQRGLLLTELATWSDCPAVPSNSPLRYWLPRWLHEPEIERTSHSGRSPQPDAWIELPPGATEIEFQDLPFLLAEVRAKAGEDEVITAARAIQFKNELGLLVDKGLVPLKNPLTGGPYEFPQGHARKTAVIRAQDLRELLAEYYNVGVCATATIPAPIGVANTTNHLSECESYSSPCTPLKRAALVTALKHEWPDIGKHLGEASRNGLKGAAHTGKHGMWSLEKVRAWGKSRGYLKQPTIPHPLQTAWTGTTTTHRISD